MESWNGNRLDGCLFAPSSPQDHLVAFTADGAIPRQVDLRSGCTPVEDQGKIGSCTANACVGALEYLTAKRDGQAVDLSRMFVYYNTRRLKGTLHLDSGASVAEAMAAVLAFGACREELWPYNPALFGAEPNSQTYLDGLQHEAIQYARVPGINGALKAVAEGYPVVFGTFIPQRCYDVAAVTGIIPESTVMERQARPSGGHCMLIVGYDLDKKVFHIRNSWGSGWGAGGYCEFPFEEMAWSCPHDSFWMLVELEPQGNFSIAKPDFSASKSPQASPDANAGSGVAATTDMLRDQIRGKLQSDIDSMKGDLRKSIFGAPTTSNFERAGQQAPGYTDDQDYPAPLPEPPPPPPPPPPPVCAICSGTKSCYHCSGSGKIWDDECRKCSGSGKCYACLYSW